MKKKNGLLSLVIMSAMVIGLLPGLGVTVRAEKTATKLDSPVSVMENATVTIGGNKIDLSKNEDDNETKQDQTEESVTVEYPPFESYQYVDGVKVTVTAEEGTFPEGTTLFVEKVEAASEVKEAVEEERTEDVKVAASYTFDIKLLDKDGYEIQPAPGKAVNVSFKLDEVADQNLNTEVYHLSEEGNDYTAESLEVSEKGTEATVETTGFSYYTVEFTYNNLQYVLNGDESIPLSTILDTVGMAGIVTAAEVSNSNLFTVSKNNNEWIVTALQAFSTNEWMKVTINNVVYEIVVTDDATLYVGSKAVTGSDSGNGWSYDATSNTLTLNNYVGNVEHSGYVSAVIYSEQELKINIIGNNTITANNGYGIFVKTGDLTIEGTGKLQVTAKVTGIDAYGSTNDLLINSGTIIAEGDDGYGITASNNVTISGGNVTATGEDAIICGQGNVTISDSTVNATGKQAGIMVANTTGKISITSSTVTANGTAYGIKVGPDWMTPTNDNIMTIDAISIVNVSSTSNAIFGIVKNSSAGTGWDNTQGTGEGNSIEINTTGRTLSYKKVQFPVHSHNFTYSANGDTITATCKQTNCSLPVVGGNHVATLTIAGGSNGATITDPYSIRGGAEVKYFEVKDDNTKGDPITGVPTNPGKYWAEITLSSGSSSATAHVIYTIEKATPASNSEKKTDNVVTCQMAGYPDNYAWNEAAKACQPGYVDDNGVFHSTANGKRAGVPNTYDEGVNRDMNALLASFLFALVSAVLLRKYS